LSKTIIGSRATKSYSPPFSLDKALDALRVLGRKWSILHSRLKELDVKPGNGWDELKSKLVATHESYGIIGPLFETLYIEQLSLGNRDCRIYDDDDFGWDGLAQDIKTQKISGSLFASVYPLPLSVVELKGLPKDHIELASLSEVGKDDLLLIFCSARITADRTQFDAAKLSQASIDDLSKFVGGFESLVAISNRYIQAFDVIVVRPKMKRMEIRLDHPGSLDSAGINDQIVRLLQVVERFHPNITQLVTSATNLFPAIQAMYLDKSSGTLEELSFGTKTSSLKKETMRRQALDLRDEDFHVGGIEKLGGADKIQPYAIKLIFQKLEMVESSVSIELRGNFRDLQIENPSLVDVRIENCRNESQFRGALKKIVSFT
jgi:hypothetical protein